MNKTKDRKGKKRNKGENPSLERPRRGLRRHCTMDAQGRNEMKGRGRERGSENERVTLRSKR